MIEGSSYEMMSILMLWQLNQRWSLVRCTHKTHKHRKKICSDREGQIERESGKSRGRARARERETWKMNVHIYGYWYTYDTIIERPRSDIMYVVMEWCHSKTLTHYTYTHTHSLTVSALQREKNIYPLNHGNLHSFW